MVNQLPGVEISGEHYGQIYPFAKFGENGASSGKRILHPNATEKDELYCMMQDWYFLHTGSDCSPGTQHGFKEVMYATKSLVRAETFKILDFISAAFPNAKFILSIRNNPQDQKDGAFKRSKAKAQTLIDNLRAWGQTQRNGAVYELALDDFSPETFTKVAAFLGHPECTATEVAHINKRTSKKRGAYTPYSAVAKANVWNCGRSNDN
jgi:hypothetical protein